MKKLVLTIAVVLFGLAVSAQSYSKDEVLVKVWGNKYAGEDVEVINYFVNGKLDHQWIWWSFQNAKYSSITDIGSIYATDRESLDELISDFETALKLSTENVNWTSKSGKVGCGESGYITINDTGKYTPSKYTFVRKKHLIKVINSLKEFKFVGE